MALSMARCDDVLLRGTPHPPLQVSQQQLQRRIRAEFVDRDLDVEVGRAHERQQRQPQRIAARLVADGRRRVREGHEPPREGLATEARPGGDVGEQLQRLDLAGDLPPLRRGECQGEGEGSDPLHQLAAARVGRATGLAPHGQQPPQCLG
eukprot:scaffold61350_cov46-Phaeocystis_antarctica.AAC.2